MSASGDITFQFQHTPFRLRQRHAVRAWLNHCIRSTGHNTGELNFLFTTDEAILAMNQLHLDHDYYTDILTFPMLSAQGLSADIVISVDRTRDNANSLNTKPLDELHRVMAHGVLHLTGLRDDTEAAKQAMREAETQWLSMREPYF